MNGEASCFAGCRGQSVRLTKKPPQAGTGILPCVRHLVLVAQVSVCMSGSVTSMGRTPCIPALK